MPKAAFLWTKPQAATYTEGKESCCCTEKPLESKWSMKKICGFAMFWVAVGMLIMLFLESVWIAVAIICILLILGYNLFCG